MKTIQELLESIIIDVEAMRTNEPGDIEEEGYEDSGHWFGPFGNSYQSRKDYTGYVEWPNLSLLIKELKQQRKRKEQ
jgi:hypothetical protein